MCSGSSSGTVIMSPIVQWLNSQYGWRLTLRVFAVMCAVCAPLMLVVTPPKGHFSLRHSESRKILSDLKIWKNRVFIVWGVAVMLAMGSYNTPGVHLIAYANDQGIPTNQASTLLIVLGLMASLGRVAWGRIIQWEILNWTNLHQTALITLGAAHMCLPLFHSYGGIMVYVLVTGSLDGCFCVLLPLLTSQFLGADRAPTVWGFIVSSSALAFMLGPSITGSLRGLTGNYYLGFHICGLASILAGLTEFLLPWARRTAKPERTLVRLFSEIHPGINPEDVDFDSVSESGIDDEIEIFSALDMQRKQKQERCRSIASSNRPSKVSFCVNTPKHEFSKISHDPQTALHHDPSEKARYQRRRCYSESMHGETERNTPDLDMGMYQVVTSPTTAYDSPSVETIVSAMSNGPKEQDSLPDPGANEPKEDLSNSRWDPTQATSLGTVLENEVLKTDPVDIDKSSE